MFMWTQAELPSSWLGQCFPLWGITYSSLSTRWNSPWRSCSKALWWQSRRWNRSEATVSPSLSFEEVAELPERRFLRSISETVEPVVWASYGRRPHCASHQIHHLDIILKSAMVAMDLLVEPVLPGTSLLEHSSWDCSRRDFSSSLSHFTAIYIASRTPKNPWFSCILAPVLFSSYCLGRNEGGISFGRGMASGAGIYLLHWNFTQ